MVWLVSFWRVAITDVWECRGFVEIGRDVGQIISGLIDLLSFCFAFYCDLLGSISDLARDTLEIFRQ